MIKRDLTNQLKLAVKKFPIVGIVGPRQSGKTTLVREVFKKYDYVNLEELDNRQFAKEDPRGFLETHSSQVIIDEVQKVPELFSYLQTHVDRINKPGQFILTGSQHFLLMEKISQSLAGRIALFDLLPLSFKELESAKISFPNYHEYIFRGGYPRIYSDNIDPKSWYSNYVQTYVERDLRNLQNVTNLGAFQTFLKLCAGRVGQLVNFSSLAQDTGISHNTARQWLSLLQESFIIFLLQPYYRNFNKRLIKSSKLYFVDTGLATWLLGINTQEQLKEHYLSGGLFENWIIAEYMKSRFNQGLPVNAYFWRDKTGHEIDLLVTSDNKLTAIEIKSGKTFNSDFIKNLNYWRKIAGKTAGKSRVIYGGSSNQKRQDINIYGWKSLLQICG
jgi:hypothetical protein